MIGLLTGTIEADEGELTVAGFDVSQERQEMERVVGFCPQFDCLYERLTGDEHLELFGRLRGVDMSARARHRRDVCEELGLDNDLLSRRVSALRFFFCFIIL